MRRPPLRVLYAAGPGDVIGTYRHWREGRDDPSQVNMTLSGLFYDLCRKHNDRAYVIASHHTLGHLRDGPFLIEHRPTPGATASGVLYHLGQVWTALRLIASAIWFRADVAVIVCGTAHWFPLIVLPLLGIKVIPSLHCVLWRKFCPPTGVPALVRKLNRPFFTRTAHRILSMSHDITEQLGEMTAGQHKPVMPFLPTYREAAFSGVAAPNLAGRPFRVFFAGRIERDKGVFDLLTIARRFKTEGIDDVVFDLCGNGSALEELKRETLAAGLTDRFQIHGYADRPRMREMYDRSHIVIVPTTAEFVEGFNQVVAEAVLAGRPVITSSVCPALRYVRDAVVEVPVGDVAAYGNAILRLRNNPAFYRAHQAASVERRLAFYDLEQGWGAALERAMSTLSSRRVPRAATPPVFSSAPAPT